MDRANRLIDKYFMHPLLAKRPRMVGAEIELPLINLKKQRVEEAFARELMEMFQKEHGFHLIKTTLEGWPCELAAPSGDVISFDTTFNTLEFAMNRAESVRTLAERFYRYLGGCLEFSLDRGYTLAGRGLNPYLEHLDPEPLHTPLNLAKSWYLREYTRHHDGRNFYAVCAAVQTHLNLEKERFLPFYNLLKQVNFIEGVLFANSPAPTKKSLAGRGALKELPLDTICFRDYVWENSGAPNTMPDAAPCGDFSDLAGRLMELKMFVVSNQKGTFIPIEPVSFREYFQDVSHPEKDIVCFRSLEPVAPTMKGTLEIRSTCTQPLAETFAPCAFYAGLMEKMEEAAELVGQFYRGLDYPATASELRSMIIKNRAGAIGQPLQILANSLVRLARDGLIERAMGEEEYLPCLEKEKRILSPALRELKKREAGISIEELMEQDRRQVYTQWISRNTCPAGGSAASRGIMYKKMEGRL